MVIQNRAVLAFAMIATLCTACDSVGGDEVPAEDVAPTVEGISETSLATLPLGVTAEMLEEGRRLYPTCSVCHGEDARGTQLGPSLRGGNWTHISGEIAEIEAIIRSGVADPHAYPVPMPQMGGGDFGDGQLRALAAYIDALGRSEIID